MTLFLITLFHLDIKTLALTAHNILFDCSCEKHIFRKMFIESIFDTGTSVASWPPPGPPITAPGLATGHHAVRPLSMYSRLFLLCCAYTQLLRTSRSCTRIIIPDITQNLLLIRFSYVVFKGNFKAI